MNGGFSKNLSVAIYIAGNTIVSRLHSRHIIHKIGTRFCEFPEKIVIKKEISKKKKYP